MKIILIITALFFPLFCAAQASPTESSLSSAIRDSIPGTSFLIKNNEVIFQKVYTSALSKEELGDKISLFLTTRKIIGYNDIQTENDFFGNLRRHKVDFKRYSDELGGYVWAYSMFSTPIRAKVAIQVKDFKYRVTVSEILFIENKSADGKPLQDMWFKDYSTQKRGTSFKTAKGMVRNAKYIDKDLADYFDLNQSTIADDF